MMDLTEAVEALRIDCDDYMRTVRALQAMANEFLWDDSARGFSTTGRAYFGASLDTSAQNRISPNRKVTPDLIIMRPPDCSILAEAKIGLPGKEAHRRERIREIQKYDDNLSGFEADGCKFRDHDISLLVSLAHANAVRDDLAAMEKVGEIKFERRFSLIRFFMTEERKTWFVLELVSGSLSNGKKMEKLRRPLQIDMEHLIRNRSFGHVKFYDAEPPLPLLMTEIHKLVLSSLTREQEFRLRETNQVDIPMTVDEMRARIADSCGPMSSSAGRTPDIPKAHWVKKALESFTGLGWATRKGREAYTYHLKRRRDPFTQFLKWCAQQQCKSAEERERRRQKEAQKLPLFKKEILGGG